MYKKIIEKLANVGTVALVGYEIGANVNNEQEHKDNTVREEKNSDVIIYGMIILLILVIAIVAKIYIKKRPIV